MKELLFDDLVEDTLRKDPELAAMYVNDVLETGDQQDVMFALRHLTRSFSGNADESMASQANAQSMYQSLSVLANPELKALSGALGSIGMKLAVVPATATAR